jgi:capsular polysaccharide biosynthesis protein
MEGQRDMHEDEIDLREYMGVIMKRKKLVISICLVSVIAAAILSFRMPKVYEITSTVQLGKLDTLLISAQDAKAIMMNKNSLSSIVEGLKLGMTAEGLQKNIRIEDVDGTNLLKVTVSYPGVAMAFKINDAIVSPLMAQGRSLYQQRLGIIVERLKELDEEIAGTSEDIAKIQALIQGLPNTGSTPPLDISLRMILLQSTLPGYDRNLTFLRNQRNELKLMLDNAKVFMIFDAPVVPKNPVGSRMKQHIFMAGMFSLMFGVFLVFFLEYWHRPKKEDGSC